jgi:site-specific DNA-methyltransferase (adenine-specific)
MSRAVLHHGDYRDVLEGWVLQHAARKTALVMDPPYRFKTTGGGKFRKARPMLDEIAEKGLDLGFDLEMLNWRNAGSIIVFCHNDQLGDIIARLKQGFARHCVCMWHKANPSPMANRHYLADTEFFVHAWQKDSYPLGAHGDKARHMTTGRFEKYGHPTTKPLELMRKIIRNVQADVILDPFMGTGTTGVAAILEGREFHGAEIVPEYYLTARARIGEAERDVEAGRGAEKGHTA